MTRFTDDAHDDQLVQPANEPVKYRLTAVEPHGWSTVVIEDNAGKVYLAVTASGIMTEISADEANELIQSRAYRRWNGDRSWTDLERLPLFDTALAHPTPESEAFPG
jgi:hypothetical protein